VADNRQNQKNAPKRLSPAEEYLYANLLWWGFLAVLALISFFTCGGVLDDITWGVFQFIFVILGGGFTLVSILDFIYETYLVKTPAEGKK
jgi:hypothetical protein